MHKYPEEGQIYLQCHQGAGSRTKMGIVFVQAEFENNVNKLPTHSPMSYDNTLKRMVGVIMVSRYSLKKGIEIFGVKAAKETSAEIEKSTQWVHTNPWMLRSIRKIRSSIILILFSL